MTEENKFYKHPQYGMVYCGSHVVPEGRICWPALVTPKAPPPPKEGETPRQPRYEASILLDKKAKAVIKFVKDLEALIEEGLILFNKGRSATLGINSIFGKYGDGDAWDHEKYPYYKGCWVLTARNASGPGAEKGIQVVDKMREKLAPDAVKGGMPGKFVVTPLITAHGVSYKLLVLQTLDDDGIRFGGGARDVMDLLDDLDSAEEEEETTPAAEAPTQETKAKPEAPAPKAAKGKAAAVNLLA